MATDMNSGTKKTKKPQWKKLNATEWFTDVKKVSERSDIINANGDHPSTEDGYCPRPLPINREIDGGTKKKKKTEVFDRDARFEALGKKQKPGEARLVLSVGKMAGPSTTVAKADKGDDKEQHRPLQRHQENQFPEERANAVKKTQKTRNIEQVLRERARLLETMFDFHIPHKDMQATTPRGYASHRDQKYIQNQFWRPIMRADAFEDFIPPVGMDRDAWVNRECKILDELPFPLLHGLNQWAEAFGVRRFDTGGYQFQNAFVRITTTYAARMAKGETYETKALEHKYETGDLDKKAVQVWKNAVQYAKEATGGGHGFNEEDAQTMQFMVELPTKLKPQEWFKHLVCMLEHAVCIGYLRARSIHVALGLLFLQLECFDKEVRRCNLWPIENNVRAFGLDDDKGV
jgi:hypothetical protein